MHVYLNTVSWLEHRLKVALIMSCCSKFLFLLLIATKFVHIFVRTRLFISLRISFCRNKEEKQKFGTANHICYLSPCVLLLPYLTGLVLVHKYDRTLHFQSFLSLICLTTRSQSWKRAVRWILNQRRESQPPPNVWVTLNLQLQL